MTIVEAARQSPAESTLTARSMWPPSSTRWADCSAPRPSPPTPMAIGAARLAVWVRRGLEGRRRRHGRLWGRTGPIPRPSGHRGRRGRPAQSPGPPSPGQVRPDRRRGGRPSCPVGQSPGHAKSRDGAVEAIRVLVVAKRSARQARVKALTQMRQLTFTAPDQLHCRIKGLPAPQFIAAAEGLAPRPVS